MKLVLCGMMGSGKTTVGKLLAEALAWEWVDTDECIVSRYGNISDIFAQKGAAYFREKETEIVKTLTQKDRLVLSTGGGIVLREENISLLRENAKIIYLRAQKQTLVGRLQGDKTRPLLQSEELLDCKIERLLQERGRLYEGAADVIVDVDDKTPTEIVEEIFACVKIK